MNEVISLPRAATGSRAPARRRHALAVSIYAIAAVNAAVIVWLWIHGGNLQVESTGDAFTSIGRLTGLLSAYLALLR